MRLLNKEIEERLSIKLDKSIRSDNASGIMRYGEDNDYPQVIEKLILGSQTGKACANIYAKFIAGDGFVNDQIGKEIVGKDNKGKPISLDNIRKQLSMSLAKFNGLYVHCNENLNKQVGDTRIIPFKNGRLSTEDDNGFSAKIAVHPNWTKKTDSKKFDKNNITWFNHFNLSDSVFEANVRENPKAFKGQVYTFFADDDYIYPLSPFDQVYLDLDTEYQIALFKNREVRNGFSDKVIMNIAPPNDDYEKEETIKKAKSWMGPDGDKLLLFESEFDENGELKQNGSFKTTEIKTNINDKLFESWEKSLANNIRKAIKALPAILIDYEQGKLSNTSGEAIVEAVDYYNALTKDIRGSLSEVIKDIYSNHISPVLSGNTVWDINDISLIKLKQNAIIG